MTPDATVGPAPLTLAAARDHWRRGDWDALAGIAIADLKDCADRGALAALVGAALARNGDMQASRVMLDQARAWGAQDRDIARIMISNAFSTLGAVSHLLGDGALSTSLFGQSAAIGGYAANPDMAARRRGLYERARTSPFTASGLRNGRDAQAAGKRVFLTFSSSNWRRSLDRLDGQARAMEVYDAVFATTEDDLDFRYRDRFADRLTSDVRGFGYWSWKPQIILQTLRQLEDGDILHYADVGCHLNPKGVPRLMEYFDLAAQAEAGVLAFQAGLPSPVVPTPDPRYTWREIDWNKGDLIDFLEAPVASDPEAGQIVATTFFIRKCANSLRLLNLWSQLFEYEWSLLDDTPSTRPNFDNFQEHRHDQAAFSLLCKANGAEVVSNLEIEIYFRPEEQWDMLDAYPIHAKRDKG